MPVQVQTRHSELQMQHHLNELSRARDSMGRATAAAMEAAKANAAPACMRLILRELESAGSTPRRIDLLYLIHSILVTASKTGLPVFRSVAGAALKQVVAVLCCDLEGAQKAAKVGFWLLILHASALPA